jgi:hypothetical protein
MKAIAVSVGVSLGSGGIQRSSAPQGAGASKARESLWQRIGACMDQLHSIVVAAWHLQRVLSKKRDPISHIGFLDEVMQVSQTTAAEKGNTMGTWGLHKILLGCLVVSLIHLCTFLNCYNDAAKFLLESQDSEKIVNLPHIINIGSLQ